MLSRRNILQSGAATGLFAALAACAPDHVADQATSTGELDAVATSRLIASGQLNAAEVLAAAIARAELAQPRINAMTNTYFDMARSATPADGPMRGTPYMIKDLLDWKGTITTYGSRAFEGNVATRNTPYMQGLLDAGLNPFAKTASPEIGLLASTEPLSHGATRNPWNIDHIPGGSSGGAAAAVAAGVIPMAHASDGGGSIRIPASCCGLFGLKPSRDRLLSHGDEGLPIRLSVNHAVSRTVRDSATLFAAMERQAGDNPAYAPVGLVTSPGKARLKIGLAIEPLSGMGVTPEIADSVAATARLCESMGHEVVEYAPPIDGPAFTEAFLMYWAAGAASFAQSAAQMAGKPPGPDILEPWTLGLMQEFLAIPQDKFAAATALLQASENTYDAMFDDIDVLLTPTIGRLPYRIGETAPTVEYAVLRERTVALAGYTPLQNAAGAPGMSVPMGWSQSGLPIGSHFSTRKGGERILLELAYELEAAQPWAQKKPPVWVG